MKKLLSIFAIAAIIGNVSAQTAEAGKDSLDGWKVGGVTSLNLTQTSLTNWSAGGQNSV